MFRRVVDPERNLRYEWEDDEGGGDEGEASEGGIQITLRRARLPRVTVIREGVVTQKTCSLVQLLTLLDGSMTVAALSKEEGRVARVAPLPDRTLLVDVEQYQDDNEHIVTGWIPPGEHPFLLGSGTRERLSMIPLPTLVYRARWSDRERSLLELSITLAPGFPEDGTVPEKLDAPLYRYPFSNVYADFRGTLEGVCWTTMQNASMALHEVPERGVRAFLSIPNNNDLYGRGLSHAAPYQQYGEFLRAVEQDGLKTSWLLPAEMTPADLHAQKRNTNPKEKIA